MRGRAQRAGHKRAADNRERRGADLLVGREMIQEAELHRLRADLPGGISDCTDAECLETGELLEIDCGPYDFVRGRSSDRGDRGGEQPLGILSAYGVVVAAERGFTHGYSDDRGRERRQQEWRRAASRRRHNREVDGDFDKRGKGLDDLAPERAPVFESLRVESKFVLG